MFMVFNRKEREVLSKSKQIKVYEAWIMINHLSLRFLRFWLNKCH